MLELWYFTCVFYETRTLHGYQHFWPCDLDLGVWPTFWMLNPANNIWIVSARAVIFHMNIPCYEIFLLVLNLLTLRFDHLNIRAFILLWQDLSTGIQICIRLILAIFGLCHYWGHLCFKTHFIFKTKVQVKYKLCLDCSSLGSASYVRNMIFLNYWTMLYKFTWTY